jgi:hypothetical protein
LSHRHFTVSFSVAVVTREKVNWIAANIIWFTVSQQILILSATVNRTLIPPHLQIQVR